MKSTANCVKQYQLTNEEIDHIVNQVFDRINAEMPKVADAETKESRVKRIATFMVEVDERTPF